MVRPTSTPLGVDSFSTRVLIHQIRPPLRIMRKSVSSNLPNFPPNAMPKAMPSFSTKHSRNHSPIT